MITMTRTCTRCKEEYPATSEYFHKQAKGKYGLKSICRDCNNKGFAKYYSENTEKMKLLYHLWQINNRDKRRAIRRRERAKAAGVLTDDWTDEQLIARYGTDCYICKDPIDFNAPKIGKGSEKSFWPDHIMPMSKGGDNIIANVRPCHRKCNESKGRKTYEEFMSKESK
jgi:5-methylcytosine-specific restriction endonuclease McrA